MANEQNLRVPSSEEAREIGRKGGIASGEARRRKRTLREIMEVYGSIANVIEPALTNDERVVIEQYNKAIAKGDTAAAAFIRDTKGEKPHDVVETPNLDVKPLVDLTKRKKNGEGKQ